VEVVVPILVEWVSDVTVVNTVVESATDVTEVCAEVVDELDVLEACAVEDVKSRSIVVVSVMTTGIVVE
jgi:hypothetical protein